MSGEGRERKRKGDREGESKREREREREKERGIIFYFIHFLSIMSASVWICAISTHLSYI